MAANHRNNYSVAGHMAEEDREQLVGLINRNRVSDVLEVVMVVCDRKEYVRECVNQMFEHIDDFVSPDAILTSD